MSDLEPNQHISKFVIASPKDEAIQENVDRHAQTVLGLAEDQTRGLAMTKEEAIRYHMAALEDLADPTSRQDGWTPFARRLFLEMLAETGRVTAACDAAGLTKQSAYALRARDPLFAAGWDAACEIARMLLADALYERAIEGVTETIERNGEVIATRHRHDSRLSIAVLHRLDKRCDRAAETGAKHLGAVARWDDFTRAIGQDDGETAQSILFPCEGRGPDDEQSSSHGQPSQLCDNDDQDNEADDRIWWDDIEEDWRTDFPPPPGFDGEENKSYGEWRYARSLTRAERDIIEAEQAAASAQEAAEDTARRDRYFAELSELLADCSPAKAGAQSPEGLIFPEQELLRSAGNGWTPAFAGEQEGANPANPDLASPFNPGNDAPDD
jgi:hypothetical protein